jgi:hypothetical protein
MSQTYPDRHHPVFFLQDALNKLGIRADFAKDERTLGCWGMVFPDFDNRVLVWLIDNRLPHEAAKEDPAAKELLARGAIVAHAQKPDMERVGGFYLPLATSPGYEPQDWVKTYDCCFIGYIRDNGRCDALADIGAKFKIDVQQGMFGDEAVEAYCCSRCGVNIPSHFRTGLDYDLNMRCMEIPACGVPMVSKWLPEMEENGFIDGVNYVSFGKDRSIIEAVGYAIDHPEIGNAGLELVQKRHTYHHRATTIKMQLEGDAWYDQ